MKICILTYPINSNFGFIMQAWALQQVIIKLGHEPITINIKEKKVSWKGKIKYHIISSFQKIIKKKVNRDWLTKKEDRIVNQNTYIFLNEHLKLTRPIFSKKPLQKIGSEFDFYIVGSDQVWRKEYVRDLKKYFFDFLPKGVKRISYAASFGKDNINIKKKEKNYISNLLKNFNAVSVREDTGIDICKNYFDIQAKLVLDPTLLLDRDDYIKLIKVQEVDQKLLNKRFILVYLLDPTDQKKKFISELAAELNLDIYILNNKNRNQTSLSLDPFPTISTWIYAFKNADFILTDSFHGTVFSIIFEKQFCVFDNPFRGSSRILSILELFNLKDKLIDPQVKKLALSTLDYEEINKIKETLKEKSLNFLRSSINE